MISFFRTHQIVVLGVVLGAIAGFLYWNFIGCNSGSCAITSKPVNSSNYGALMGGVLFSMFKKEPKNNKE